MGLYLEKAIFVNRAPFEHIELDFKKNGINVLSAINGKGKTTIISHIVDAFHEMARPYFPHSYEGVENKYYRFSSSLFHLDSNKYSLVYLRFIDANNEAIDYIDCRGNITSESYEEVITLENKIPYQTFQKTIRDYKYVKTSSKNYSKVKAIDLFSNEILTYFPSYRYEQPVYLNDPYKIQLSFNVESEFNGTLTNPIEVISGLPQLANWIMDVVLDWEVYRQTQKIKMSNGDIKNIDTTPEALIFSNLNEILSLTLSSKKYIGKIRFGIGKRTNGGQRISIMNDIDGIKSHSISPNIFSLSSGESALLSMFGEILRQGDKLRPNANMESLTGIVLIDEVDKHLHITLQKEVLPKLFNLFPNIQFIVSSHSPFLNMGLADEALIRTQIIDLDNNGVICEPTNNELYKEVYDMMVNENQRFADKFNELKSRVQTINKPIIITEGKTDYRHIKNAIKILGRTDIDIDFFEVPDGWGDSKLKTLLDNLSLIKQKNIVIGIFDRDSPDYLKYVDADTNEYKAFGDSNVYAFAIPLVNENIYGNAISIEHYYYKKDLLKVDDKTKRRLFLGSEFYKVGNSIDGKYQTKISKIDHKVEINGIIDDKVYSRDDLEQKTNVALTKNAFTELIENDESFSKDIDFSNFNKIIDVISDIVRNHKN